MRTPSSDYRRPVTVTLPSALVAVFDSTLLRGENRSKVVERLIREEVVRRGADVDAHLVKKDKSDD